jgi:hypothetical protein
MTFFDRKRTKTQKTIAKDRAKSGVFQFIAFRIVRSSSRKVFSKGPSIF